LRPASGLSGPLARRVARFERRFRASLAVRKGVPARLAAAIRYTALSGGKRVRPLLALCACEAVGGRWPRALPMAVALECVHAFSLVHDDLPAMDDDDYRRGRPTTHRRFDEATALLAGDALIAMAFEELAGPAAGIPPRSQLHALRVLARAAGPAALVGGQMLDLEAEGKPARVGAVRRIHRLKTAALIRAALMLGGVAGGASPGQLRRLERIGDEAGLAFQIRDDLMNQDSTLACMGKRAGTDRERGKATYPAAVGADAARREAARRVERARCEALAFGRRGAALVQLLDFLAHRES
jgi:geranylgeranyl diphosphate synthase type II